MLKLLTTVPRWRSVDSSGPMEDVLGLFWGSGGLEVFRFGSDGLRSWKAPESIQDLAQLRVAVDAGVRNLGGRLRRAVVVLLHPELIQFQLEVPAAAPASAVRTRVQRTLSQQKPGKVPTRWRDIPLIPSGNEARRLVFAMPEELYRSIHRVLGELGIEVCSLVPFSGLVFLDADMDGDVAVLEAWHLPCGLIIGLRRGPDFWMVRPLVLDPEDVRRVSRELRQTLGFAREHWALVGPRIRLRGPAAWTRDLLDVLRSDGLGNDPLEIRDNEDWRSLVLKRAMGSGVDLAPMVPESIRPAIGGPSTASIPVIYAIIPGLLLVAGLTVEVLRIRGRIVAVEHARQIAEQTLEELEIWTLQRDHNLMLVRPWQDDGEGVPDRDPTTWIAGGLPDGLVLTELDLWRTESGWHLVLAGQSQFPNEAAMVEALDAELSSRVGAHPVSLGSKPAPESSGTGSWAELLAGESRGTVVGSPTRFRREWILP